MIRYVLKQASQYELRTHREVGLYVNLMLLLGSDFDTDIQLPWAVKALKDESIAEPFMRIKRLYDMAMDYLDQVVGINNEHLERALLKIRGGSSIQTVILSSHPMTEQQIMALLSDLYPQKCEAVGENNLFQLIKHGTKSAQHDGLTHGGGTTLYVGLMFMLGEHFDRDLQFPWASSILKDPSLVEPKTKTQSLYTEARAQLDRWMS